MIRNAMVTLDGRYKYHYIYMVRFAITNIFIIVHFLLLALMSETDMLPYYRHM